MILKLYALWTKFWLDVEYLRIGGLKLDQWSRYKKAEKIIKERLII